MIIRINVTGLISQGQLLELHALCRKQFGDEVEIHPRPGAFGIEIEAAGAISGVVAAIVAIISLGFQIRKQTKEAPWSLERLKNELATECARRGLPDVRIVSIINFESLIEATKEPCKVRVAATDGSETDIYVFSDGSKYSIQVD